MFSWTRRYLPLQLLLALSLAVTIVSAGEVQVSWDPSADATEYRLYRSTTSGDFSDFDDVGNTTETQANGLDDCTLWYFVVTASNAAGESGPSSEVATWPRAILTTASPDEAEPGSQAVVVVAGINFQAGDLVQFGDPAIQIDSVSVDSCSQLTLALTIDPAAVPGPVDLQVTHANGVSGTGIGLFSVIPIVDDTEPVITNLQVSDIDGTSALITWTTDEPADSRVFFRKSGATNYQATTLDPGLVTDHSVDLFGLEPDTTYEYHVTSADAADNTATSSPDDTFITFGSPFVYLRFESESGVLVDPVRETPGAGAFGGAWIDTPAGGSTGTPNNPAGTATYGVNVPETGIWFLWVRMYAENGNANSWFESMEGSTREIISTNSFDAWVWVAGEAYVLDAGLRTVELGGREAETRADRLLLTNDPDFVPSEEPDADIVPPQGVAGLQATPGAEQIDLSWTNPSDADFVKTVLRFRTDGQFPTSPIDGLPLVEQAAAPGSPGSFLHEGLSEGATYSYSAFAIDAAGNVSAASTVEGSPMGLPPAAPGGVVVF
jgi:hypothetical protein